MELSSHGDVLIFSAYAHSYTRIVPFFAFSGAVASHAGGGEYIKKGDVRLQVATCQYVLSKSLISPSSWGQEAGESRIMSRVIGPPPLRQHDEPRARD